MSNDKTDPVLGAMLESLEALGTSTKSKVSSVPAHKKCESLHTTVKGKIAGLLAESSLTEPQINLLAVLLNSPAATCKEL